jgi:hypothetical protein
MRVRNMALCEVRGMISCCSLIHSAKDLGRILELNFKISARVAPKVDCSRNRAISSIPLDRNISGASNVVTL